MLKNKAVIITGGGRGIGRGIADKMLAAGAKLVIAQRSELEQELKDNPNVTSIQADLSEIEGFDAIIQTAIDTFGKLDCIVNNAGIMFERSLEHITAKDWDLMMAINLRAPMLLSQAALPYLRQGKNATIINIGSIEGSAANPLHAAYCSSKAGLHGLTRALAVDLGKDGIRVNAIAPGWIHTNLSETYLNTQENPGEARKALDKLHPLGRTGLASDVGDLAVYLASEQAAFLTGQIITVDGGRMTKIPLPF